jgi:hypothetical protein
MHGIYNTNFGGDCVVLMSRVPVSVTLFLNRPYERKKLTKCTTEVASS